MFRRWDVGVIGANNDESYKNDRSDSIQGI